MTQHLPSAASRGDVWFREPVFDPRSEEAVCAFRGNDAVPLSSGVSLLVTHEMRRGGGGLDGWVSASEPRWRFVPWTAVSWYEPWEGVTT